MYVTSYVMYVPLADKPAHTVVSTYFKDTCSRFGVSRKMLSDSQSEPKTDYSQK